jgi:dolichol-phosphate mannosyltransferase
MPESLAIIPTYNERENIEAIIRKVLSYPEAFHMLIVDDGSPDGTAQIVKDLQKEFADRLFLKERTGKQGLGTAYILGFQWAIENKYELIFEIDADFSHNPDDLLRLRQACLDGADLAIGSRYCNGVNVVNWPMSRVLTSYYGSMYVRMMTGMTIRDTTAGFKCYKRRVLETIDFNAIKLIGYGFQIEMKFRTWKHGFKIVEVPIIFQDRTAGASKMSKGIIKEAFIGVFLMKVKSWFTKYKQANEITN